MFTVLCVGSSFVYVANDKCSEVPILTALQHSITLGSVCNMYSDVKANIYHFCLALNIKICRGFCSGAVAIATRYFNDLGMSRTGIKPRSPTCEVNNLLTKPPRR